MASQPAVRIEDIDARPSAGRHRKCLAGRIPAARAGQYTVVLEAAAAGDLVERIGARCSPRTKRAAAS